MISNTTEGGEMNNGYKVWHVQYRMSGSWGIYHDLDTVVVAETGDKAIGMVAQNYEDTLPDKRYWDATEIDTEREGVHHITQSES